MQPVVSNLKPDEPYMKTSFNICLVLIFFTISCKNNTKRLEPQVDTFAEFDEAEATVIIEKRSREFEEALIAGDSIAVGDIYTIDTRIIPSLSGRDAIVGAAGSMIRHNQTLQLTINNLWGDDNIIIEDAYVKFYNNNGEVASKGDVLLVWKNDGNEWRIFRDVYKPDEE
jgi:ketosteroid isomerase-like protein